MLRASWIQTVPLTLLALVAFAANSLLTRLALAPRLIDPASFTLVRLAAGAITLALVVRAQSGRWFDLRGGGAVGPLALFGYAAPFTFAYVRLGAAVGTLVAFGSVQLTMIGWGLARGERPALRTWCGLVLAAGGLAALALPAASRPDPVGSALMATAGVAWGVYSLRGRAMPNPLAANARNFLLAAPLALMLSLLLGGQVPGNARGVLLAVLSGAVTSGLGYVIWYRALRGLAATQAAVVQLAVPILATLGAIPLLGEKPTVRLVLCGLAVLAGIALALSGRAASRAARTA